MFNGVYTTGESPATLLALIPRGEHPSHPGYAQAALLRSWSSSTVALHHGRFGPKTRSKSKGPKDNSQSTLAHQLQASEVQISHMQISEEKRRNQISELLEDMITQVIHKMKNDKEKKRETIKKRTHHSTMFDPLWEDRATQLANDLNKLITLEQKQERSVSDDERCIRMYKNLPKLFMMDIHCLKVILNHYHYIRYIPKSFPFQKTHGSAIFVTCHSTRVDLIKL